VGFPHEKHDKINFTVTVRQEFVCATPQNICVAFLFFLESSPLDSRFRRDDPEAQSFNPISFNHAKATATPHAIDHIQIKYLFGHS
jgi:hypothetical protein